MSEPGPFRVSFTDPQLFTVGTVGEVGRRLFFFQVRDRGSGIVTVKVEKQQVAALGVSLGQMLARLPRPGPLPSDLGPEEPIEPLWAVSRLAISYESDRDRIVLVADEIAGRIGREGDEDDEDDEDVWDEEPGAEGETPAGARLEVTITREQAAALVLRAVALVAAGRPPCPLCGHPLDPSGHECPRTNGHRPPRA